MVQNDVRSDPESMDLNGVTIQKVVQNDVRSDSESVDLNGGLILKVVQDYVNLIRNRRI